MTSQEITSYSAITLLRSKAQAKALGEALEDLDPVPTGVGILELEDGSGLWEVGAYFIEAPDEIALALLAAAFEANHFQISQIPDTDWVAKVKRELHPVRAGRFFLYGSHDTDAIPPEPGIEPLLIEASMAFGTGHHGTTESCLWALENCINDKLHFENIADIGCGTAVLAMAGARAWPQAKVIASDIDPVAIDVANANLAANALSNRIKAVVAPGFEQEDLAAQAPYDLVLANILMGPLIALAPSLVGHLRPRGIAILSGLLNEQAEAVIKAYQVNGMDCLKTHELGEWTTLTLQKGT